MKKNIVIAVLVAFCFCFYLLSCNNNGSPANEQARAGFELASKHCGSCHLLPRPEMLEKQIWLNHVLPKMGSLLGFRSLGSGRYYDEPGAAMKPEEWNNIVYYYYTEAPEKLEPNKIEFPITTDTLQFTAEVPAFSVPSPATTVVQLNTNDTILFGDGSNERLYRLVKGQLLDSMDVAVGPAHVHNIKNGFGVLSMGVLYPSDQKKGKLLLVEAFSKNQWVLIDSLRRPVHATYTDLNNDGLEDVVICEFGNTIGALSWFQQTTTGTFVSHVLRALPGAVQSAVYDFNNDGLPDIVALMAQGDEGLFIYYNKGKGVFKEERLLRFPASFGSNSFQMVDFNKDGFMDIMATNGDNGDYPPIIKPYHGIRLYLNNQHNQFKEQFFLPVNGVGKAIAHDFDQDGDIDIASIAYFPDFENRPEEGFIYWKNTEGKFSATSMPAAIEGRWLTMDYGDLDGDGDTDIVLGNANFSLGNVPEKVRSQWNHYSPSVIILRNKLH